MALGAIVALPFCLTFSNGCFNMKILPSIIASKSRKYSAFEEVKFIASILFLSQFFSSIFNAVMLF